jgi:acetyltransferase-like isoleucine patch superfamily enzyme
MKPKAVLKNLIWHYQKTRLGRLGKNSNISLWADFIGDRKKVLLGRNVTICKYATLEADPSEQSDSQISIGDNTLISSFAMLRTYGGSIHIGHSSFINSFSILYGHGTLRIGNGCLVGPQVCIVPVNYGFQDRTIPLRLQQPSLKGIVLEDEVWVGAGATILDGCIVGKGSIVGAGAVLTKSVEPYSIVAGVPAKVIAHRE